MWLTPVVENIATLCPELSAGMLAGDVISKTELDRPSET